MLGATRRESRNNFRWRSPHLLHNAATHAREIHWLAAQHHHPLLTIRPLRKFQHHFKCVAANHQRVDTGDEFVVPVWLRVIRKKAETAVAPRHETIDADPNKHRYSHRKPPSVDELFGNVNYVEPALCRQQPAAVFSRSPPRSSSRIHPYRSHSLRPRGSAPTTSSNHPPVAPRERNSPPIPARSSESHPAARPFFLADTSSVEPRRTDSLPGPSLRSHRR